MSFHRPRTSFAHRSPFRPRCERLEDRCTPTGGHLDPTFGYGGVRVDNVRFQSVTEIALPDGKYLAAGTTESIYQTDFALARFNADCTVDTTFAKDGLASLDFNNSSDLVNDVVLLQDGKILVVGSTGKVVDNVFTEKTALARYNADGSLDTTFGNGGTVVGDAIFVTGFPQRAFLAPDGKIVLVGVSFVSSQYQLTLARLNPDGSVDSTYGNNGIARPNAPITYTFVAQGLGDGRILVAGPSSPGNSIALIRADGTLDPTFGAGGVALLNDINPHVIAIQGDGKILVAGDYYSTTTSSNFAVERLNADGSADSGFGTNGRVQTDFHQTISSATAIAVLPDGKILVGGQSLHDYPIIYPYALAGDAAPGSLLAQFHHQFALVRYYADGTMDTSFGVEGRVLTPVGSGASMNKLVVQPDGKILAIGTTEQNSYYFYPYAGSYYLSGGLAFARYEGTGARTRYIATGAGPGGGPHVKVFDAVTGELKYSFYAYAANFTGGVRVATGDVTGDGVDDIVCGAGTGGAAHVRIYDGTDGHLLREFIAYDPAFSGGVYVAVGDVTGDGKAEIITGAGEGGGPHVKIFDGATGSLLDEFMAYGSGFRGGVRVAAADANGDGLSDIVTGAGVGGGPHVKVFDGKLPPNNWYVTATAQQRVEIVSTLAFAADYTDGIFVAAGDLNGDGKAEIIVGQGKGPAAKVRVIRASDSQVIAESAPFADTAGDGVRLAVVDRTNDGRGVILAGAGAGSTKVRTLNGATLAQKSEFTAYDPGFQGGVFVG